MSNQADCLDCQFNINKMCSKGSMRHPYVWNCSEYEQKKTLPIYSGESYNTKEFRVWNGSKCTRYAYLP